MSDTSVLEHTSTDTTTQTSHGDGSHDAFSHYVSKTDLGLYYLEGILPTAVCGKQWAPSLDVAGRPVCDTCKAIYGQMQAGDPDNPDYGK